MSKTSEHIAEDWSDWLHAPSLKVLDCDDADHVVNLRFKANGPIEDIHGPTMWRMGLLLTSDMTVQEQADCFIRFGERMRRFVMDHEGGKV